MVGEWWHFIPERVVIMAGGSHDGSFGLRATQQPPNWLLRREQDEEIRILIPLFPPQTLSVPLWMKSPSSRRAREPVGCRLQTSASWGTEQGGDGAKRADRESPAQVSPFCPLVFTHTGSRKLTFLTRKHLSSQSLHPVYSYSRLKPPPVFFIQSHREKTQNTTKLL